ncbi:sensor histidine kinase [Halovivax gelatinilyticus]|uniref:sensor histidine kinase n=1 Tax=Halovivax gelatinilyticus TaxID=2961597 RepID=UPI0020CA449A|nr:PAS domain-containing sensor histidine kinase [Halovivax gelatinilyticus]
MSVAGRRLPSIVRQNAVALVGVLFLAVAVSYALGRGGDLSQLLLEVLFMLVVGVALVWDGVRGRLADSSPRRSTLVAAGALVGAAIGALIAGWAVLLAEMRMPQAAAPLQMGLLGWSIGGGVGAVIGHNYTSLVAKHRQTVRLSRAIDSSMDGVAIIEDGDHVYVNDAYAELYGFHDPVQLEGEPWHQLYTNDALGTIEREIIPALSEHSFWRGRLTGRRADGTTFPKEVTSSTVGSGNVLVVRDVSVQRQREQRIQVLNRVLRHNLRNTFTVIQGHANLLADQAPSLEASHVEPIREEIDDLLATADKARGVERTIDRHGEVYAVAPSEAVRSVVDRATAAYPDASIRSHVQESGLPDVDSRVTDALDELVDNAIEHATDPEPTVEVAVSSTAVDEHSRVEFTVTDDGPGIPESDRQAVLDGEETPLAHSSGLGLWLVNWIVHSTGGSLSFDEPYGGGTAVTITYREDDNVAFEPRGEAVPA